MNEMFAQALQNTLIVVSETSNETIATRAKFTKNVITHAMNLGITKITATPATMTLMIYLPISYIEANSKVDSNGDAKFTWDKDIPIYVDKFEYHSDYDIIFTSGSKSSLRRYCLVGYREFHLLIERIDEFYCKIQRNCFTRKKQK